MEAIFHKQKRKIEEKKRTRGKRTIEMKRRMETRCGKKVLYIRRTWIFLVVIESRAIYEKQQELCIRKNEYMASLKAKTEQSSACSSFFPRSL